MHWKLLALFAAFSGSIGATAARSDTLIGVVSPSPGTTPIWVSKFSEALKWQ